jgi:tRNA threonylcarbamoyladenosine biosynthesis protein TsaB
MGELYFAAFEREAVSAGDEKWNVVHPPQLCAAAAAPRLDGAGWIGVGSGFAAHGEVLAQHYSGRLIATRAELHPRAQDLAALAAGMVRSGLTVAAEEARPVYLRDRVALTSEERRALKAARGARAEHP